MRLERDNQQAFPEKEVRVRAYFFDSVLTANVNNGVRSGAMLNTQHTAHTAYLRR